MCVLKEGYDGMTSSLEDKPIPDEAGFICLEEDQVRIFDVNANKPDNDPKTGVNQDEGAEDKDDNVDALYRYMTPAAVYFT